MQLCTTNSYSARTNFLHWIILEHIKRHNTIGKYNQRKIISFPQPWWFSRKTYFSRPYSMFSLSCLKYRLFSTFSRFSRSARTLQPVLCAYVLTCQHVLHAYVPMCLACLRAHMSTCLTSLCAHVLRALHAHVPTCLACFAYLCAHIL